MSKLDYHLYKKKTTCKSPLTPDLTSESHPDLHKNKVTVSFLIPRRTETCENLLLAYTHLHTEIRSMDRRDTEGEQKTTSHDHSGALHDRDVYYIGAFMYKYGYSTSHTHTRLVYIAFPNPFRCITDKHTHPCSCRYTSCS